MKRNQQKILRLALAIGLTLTSCSDDTIPVDETTAPAAVNAKASITTPAKGHFDLDFSNSVREFKPNLKLTTAVEPSECGDTPFNEVADYYNDLLIDGFISAWDGNPDAITIILEDYFAINQIAAAYEGKNTDYFGADGEYTNYVKQQVRSLEKFWGMANLITVNGQHTETLEDLDFIQYIYENYSSAPPEEIDYILEIAENFNTNSDQIPENPFFASDGFATFDRTIVIGDGIVTLLEETGLDPKVVWSSILAHEWGHQIQFLNFDDWQYPIPAFNDTPESTRMTELEADFITGYFLTHKRGATYNWKRVEDFLSAFFNIGDCGFESPGHHGTPAQRLAAAKAGFDLANGTKKKGQILSQQEVHNAFLSELDAIVGTSASRRITK
ncbi:hypothetical protein [Zobellia alginiliquefaciens]|uniref:hypothetical protein n=1 Tax=Zobellia alginiliquefaciens TaxID=3032586 RepID=UPI0023E42DEE|nr:hypothetical protein [Zobellia alginiliquefaciens]